MTPSTSGQQKSDQLGGYREKKLTEENPRPPVIPMVFDLGQSRREKSAKSTRQRRRAVEQTDPVHHLVAAVEHGQVDDDTAEQAALEQAEEHPGNDQPGKGLGEAEAGAHDAPCSDERGQVEAGSDALDDPVAGDVDQDVGDVEDENGDVEFCARVDVEIDQEAVNGCISDVAPVDEGEEPVCTPF